MKAEFEVNVSGLLRLIKNDKKPCARCQDGVGGVSSLLGEIGPSTPGYTPSLTGAFYPLYLVTIPVDSFNSVEKLEPW
jgi:hypothetical protein